MIIAIPCMNNTLDSPISMQFGRAPYFYIYDFAAKDGKFIQNNAVSSPGGAGVKAADQIIHNQVDVLLSANLGENAINVLKRTAIEIIEPLGKNVSETLKLYIDKRA
ncbi:MAG: NifB/NifX family molybdenum-iron cluster-binding protein [Candidatus Izemoplasmatales bacterium]